MTTRGAQYGVIKEYGLNYVGIHNMISAIVLNSATLGSLGIPTWKAVPFWGLNMRDPALLGACWVPSLAASTHWGSCLLVPSSISEGPLNRDVGLI